MLGSNSSFLPWPQTKRHLLSSVVTRQVCGSPCVFGLLPTSTCSDPGFILQLYDNASHLPQVLLDWINDVLAEERIIVKQLEEDLYDGQVLQKLLGEWQDPSR